MPLYKKATADLIESEALNGDVRVQFQVITCGTCGGHSGSGTCSPQVCRFTHTNYYSTNYLYPFTVRAVAIVSFSVCSSKWLGLNSFIKYWQKIVFKSKPAYFTMNFLKCYVSKIKRKCCLFLKKLLSGCSRKWGQEGVACLGSRV